MIRFDVIMMDCIVVRMVIGKRLGPRMFKRRRSNRTLHFLLGRSGEIEVDRRALNVSNQESEPNGNDTDGQLSVLS
jgi:hypothetical protein